MKLRIKGNSIRVRLDRRDLAQLVDQGRVADRLSFGPGADQALIYAVQVAESVPQSPFASYTPGHILLEMNRADVENWSGSERVGYDVEQASGEHVIRIVLEKDFACLDRPPADAADDAWAFPNPAQHCSPPVD